jgi:hypothetical protein
MERVLPEVPEMSRTIPPGVVAVPTMPYPALPGETKLVPEFFYQEAIPPPEVLQPPPVPVEPPPGPPALPAEQANPPA